MSPMESVPVFPLPGVVLLPDQRLPLHIFEPRYRAMVRDSLSSHGWLVVCPIGGSTPGPIPRPSRPSPRRGASWRTRRCPTGASTSWSREW